LGSSSTGLSSALNTNKTLKTLYREDSYLIGIGSPLQNRFVLTYIYYKLALVNVRLPPHISHVEAYTCNARD